MNKTKQKSWLQGLNASEIAQRVLIIIMLVWLCIFLVVPMVIVFSQVVTDNAGNFVGLNNFVEYFQSPLLSVSIVHSLSVSLITAAVSTSLGLLFAYGITRTNLKGKGFYRYAGMLPLFIPTMVHGMALVYIFGNMGFLTNMGIDIGLYGKTGIILSEVFYTFPQAFLVLVVALAGADNRLYEAASVLGSSPFKTFCKVTLPSIKYGLVNSFILCFTLSFTDFGAPQIVGGSYSVLATDIYKQVVGQQNMSMGAVVGVILTIPALIAFLIDCWMRKRSGADEVSSKAATYEIPMSGRRDTVYQIFCSLVLLAIFILLGSVIMSAFVTRWPNDMSFTLEHFNFGEKLLGSGIGSFANSCMLALGTAVGGTVLVFICAYMLEKSKAFPRIRGFCRFLAMMPMALPGLVLGLSYIMFFNKEWIEIPFMGIAIENSFHGLYRTMALMIICNITHMFSVTFVTAVTSLKKLDEEYENVADSLSVPFWELFGRVTLPMCVVSVLEIFVYFFVNAMVTVSAIVFLYTSATRPAAIAILNMDDNGDYAAAAAMSVFILLINIGVRIIYEFVNRILVHRLEKYKTGGDNTQPQQDLKVDRIELELMQQILDDNM